MSKDVTVSNVKTTIHVEDATSIKNEKATQETENILGAKKIKDELVSPEDYRYAIYGVGYGKVPILLMSFEDGDYQGAVTYAKDACNDDITCYLFDTARSLKGRSRALIYACSPSWTLNSDEKYVWIEANEDTVYFNWHGEEITWGFIPQLPPECTLEDFRKMDFLNIDAAVKDIDSKREDSRRFTGRPEPVDEPPAAERASMILGSIFDELGISEELLKTTTPSLSQRQREDGEDIFKKRYAALLGNILKIIPTSELSRLDELENPCFRRSRNFFAHLKMGRYGKYEEWEQELIAKCMEIVNKQLWGGHTRASINDVVLRALSFDLAGIDIVPYISIAYKDGKAIQTFIDSYHLKNDCCSETHTDSSESR